MLKRMINKEIKEFITDKFIYDGVLTDDLSLTEMGVLDSMGVIVLITYIESKYDINVDDEEINQVNFGSINKIVNYIELKLNVI